MISKNRRKGNLFLHIGPTNYAKSRANGRKQLCNPLHKWVDGG